MCIICNMRGDMAATEAASDYLYHQQQAHIHMRKASENMLVCSKVDRKYDKAHKRIVRSIRAWQDIEETREKGE